MIGWGSLTVSFCITVLLTWGLIRVSISRHWFDRPVDRSAHKRPMPSGGGIAMTVVFLVTLLFYNGRGMVDATTLMLFAGCLPLALVGYIDDLRGLSIRWRLAAQLASALWVIYWVGDLPAIQFGGLRLENSPLINLLAVVSFVWLLNLFNFMDGIDGLAASEAVIVMLVSCLLATLGGETRELPVASLAIAVTLGFLFWNWPPAKIFMGDAGSNFLAYLIGALALTGIANGGSTPWVWLLLLGVFVVDSTYTLAYRLIDRQTWYQGHSNHGYQHAARRAGSHRRVTVGVITITLLWLAPLGGVATVKPEAGFYLAVIGLMPLLYLARRLRAGTPAVEMCGTN